MRHSCGLENHLKTARGGVSAQTYDVHDLARPPSSVQGTARADTASVLRSSALSFFNLSFYPHPSIGALRYSDAVPPFRRQEPHCHHPRNRFPRLNMPNCVGPRFGKRGTCSASPKSCSNYLASVHLCGRGRVHLESCVSVF